MHLRSLFEKKFATPRMTLLGAGPMSKRSTDMIIELANRHKRPIAMIPSRRQVDAEHLGGGYVNNWATEDFVRYVRSRDKGGFVLLARDHSGPWQHKVSDQNGKALSHIAAMLEVKESLDVDIQSGFDLIHIDTSSGLAMGRSQSQIEEDILELLEYCQSKGRSGIEYEIGADEQSSVPDLTQIAEDSLIRVLTGVMKLGLKKPMFYVLQTGTKVMETRNIGSFDSKLPVQGMLPSSIQLPEIIRMCVKHGVYLKEHNADYLSDEALVWHRRYGIHAANVAPEFGVSETRALMQIASLTGYEEFITEFGNIVLGGRKWEKWMVPGSSANDLERIQIAGHYHFSDQRVVELIERLEEKARHKTIDLDAFLNDSVRNSIQRYLFHFGYGDV